MSQGQYFTPPPPPHPFPHDFSAQVATSGMAVASLILAVLGLITFGVTGVIGIILGIIALVRISKSQGRMKGSGLAGAAIGVGALSLLSSCFCAGLLLPAFAKARMAAQSLKADTQLKQLGATLAVYSFDNKDYLPSAADWDSVLSKELGDVSPLVEWPAKSNEGRAFAMNAKLDGIRLPEVREPSRTVLLFEVAANSPPFGGPELLPQRPRSGSGGYLVLFVDRHTDKIPPERLSTLRWDP